MPSSSVVSTGPRRFFRPALVLAITSSSSILVYDLGASAADIKRVAMLLVSLCFIITMLVRRAPRPTSSADAGYPLLCAPPAFFLWLGFVAWSALSLTWGVLPVGLGDLYTWMGASIIAFWALTLPEEEARLATELSAFMVGTGSALICLVQLWIWRGAGPGLGFHLHGGQGNPNWLGLVLALTLTISVAKTWQVFRQKSPWRLLALAAVGMQLLALWLSHSRVGYLAVITGLGVLFLRWPRVKRFVPLALVVLLTLTIVLAYTIPTPVSASSSSAERREIAPGGEVDMTTSLRGRRWIWRSTLDAMVKHLPWGVGLGGFPHAYLPAQGAHLARLEPRFASRNFINATSAHHDWLQVMLESGLPAIFFLGLAWTWAARAELTPWPAGWGALMAFGICALGDSPLRQPGVVLLFVLVLTASPRSRRVPFPRILSGAMLMGASLLLAGSTRAWIAGRYLARAAEEGPTESLALLQRAAQLDPRSGEIALALGLKQLELGDPQGALPELVRSRRYLANVGTEVAIGNAHFFLGQAPQAREAYLAALQLNPGSFRAHANLASVLLKLKRFTQAEEQLRIAQSLWPGHPKLAEIRLQLQQERSEEEAP